MTNELATTTNQAQLNHRQATDVAGLCRDIVVKTSQPIQGRKYVRVEGWQSIAAAHGCIASIDSVTETDDGVIAVASLLDSSGNVRGKAEGYVGKDEKLWAARPKYAQRAMAQTRAISRVCRSAFAHVVVLMDAGLETTPAEEIPVEQDSPIVEAKPVKSYTPAPKPVQEVVHTEPLDSSSWRTAQIHFGKNKGKTLGQLDENQLQWYQSKWQPTPWQGQMKTSDLELRAALDASMGKITQVEVNLDVEVGEVPF
jgi:uncharacterized protein (DUF3820 family)